ncbi:TetR/AcrR family transcriptional regulator [Acetobacter sacchari]|uniref:TetR/AcrR family transcriptional regulator n=1 Tax=Acetobacter sacchari TaxID=2661687 RepID=A0ABS3LZM2_9PROT|nr:TetR/AcrR family transcriptional regulator [Acetobacter sacchari]MBO1361358.1 TetR/AcrR family transcriptional regulator [Acetobacter sacchari]
MGATERDSYHHGDLRAALIEASESIIREEGVEGFTLRKAAKRAGVSPGAPSHHFKGTKGLLTVVAIRVFQRLGAELAILPVSDVPARDLRTQAEGYVTFAAQNPGLFRLICRVDLIDCQDQEFREASFSALVHYRNAAAAYFGEDPPDRAARIFRPYLASAFATAHGLAHMILEGRPALLFDTPDPAETFIETTLPSILLATWPDRPCEVRHSA